MHQWKQAGWEDWSGWQDWSGWHNDDDDDDDKDDAGDPEPIVKERNIGKMAWFYLCHSDFMIPLSTNIGEKGGLIYLVPFCLHVFCSSCLDV